MSDKLFKKIGVLSTAEIIAERFDDALDLMHKDAVVYGGAIRDLVAGLPILGDLDIAAAGSIYNHTLIFFRMSSKWTEVRDRPLPQTLPKRPYSKKPKPITKPSTRMVRKSGPTIPKTSVDLRGGYASKSIAAVSTFKTFDDAQVQVMQASSNSPLLNPADSVFDIVKNVDIRCCGLVLDSKGNVYEVVEGAHQDCIDRVLRINKIDDNLDLKYLKSRIEKLEKRGWASKINIASIKARLKKKEQERKKSHEEWEKRQIKKRVFNQWMTVEKSTSDKFQCVVLNKEITTDIGNLGTVDTLVRNAGDAKGVRIYSSEPQPNGTWKVDVSSGMAANTLCKELRKEIKNYFSNRKRGGPKSGEKKIHAAASRVFSADYGSKSTKAYATTNASPREAPVDFEADYFMTTSDAIDMPDTPSEVDMPDAPPEADEHTHHFEARLRDDGEISIDSTNRDASPGEGITIDVSDVPEEALQEVRHRLKNALGSSLSFESTSRDTIRATPRGLRGRPQAESRTHAAIPDRLKKQEVRGGIITPTEEYYPEVVAEPFDGPYGGKKKRTKRKRR